MEYIVEAKDFDDMKSWIAIIRDSIGESPFVDIDEATPEKSVRMYDFVPKRFLVLFCFCTLFLCLLLSEGRDCHRHQLRKAHA